MTMTVESPLLVPEVVLAGDAPIAAFHAWLLRDAIARSPDVRRFRDYYAGQQPHSLTEGQLVMLEGLVAPNPDTVPASADEWSTSDAENGGAGYLCDNICKIVVDALQSRVLMDGFRVDDVPAQTLLDDIWVTAGIDDLQNEVHRNSFRDGDAYVILGFDRIGNRVIMDVQAQWVQEDTDGAFGAGTHLVYDDGGQPWVAIKEWVEYASQTLTRRRRTLYYADRIERYAIDFANGQAATSDWQPFVLMEDGGAWPVPIRTDDGSDVTLPVVHFPNVRGQTRYGISELAGDILGKQRLYNDAQHALAAATRMSANQLITATGVSETESAVWKVGPAQVLGTARPDARIGSIGAADLSPIINSAKRVLESVSHSSSIPLHHFTGQWPSGEALMRAEIPMVSKSRDRQTRMGHAWASLMHKVTLVANAFSGTVVDTTSMISASWHDPALRDDKYVAEMMAVKAPFLSEEQVLREFGYTDQQITLIIGEREAKAARVAEQALALATAAPPTTTPPSSDEDRVAAD